MCGLFGAISSTLTKEEVEAVLDLGILTQLRGMHSTGLVCVSREKNTPAIDWLKDKVNSSTLLTSKNVEDLIRKNPYIIAGHCRHATVGSISTKNAHPFVEGHIIGMHNGTLTFRSGKIPDDMTDSQFLYKKVSQNGIEDTVKDVLGAYALVWFDQKQGTLNFLRNNQRPLFVMHGNGTTYWSSEYSMLDFIRKRSVGYGSTEEPSTVPTDTLVTISMASPRAVSTTPCKQYEQYSMNCSWFDRRKQEEQDKKEESCSRSEPIEDVADTLDLPFKPDPPKTIVMGPTKPLALVKDSEVAGFKYYAYRGRAMDKDKARDCLVKGCSYCDRTATLREKVHFFNKDSFLCNACAQIESRVQYVGARIDDIWETRLELFKREKHAEQRSVH